MGLFPAVSGSVTVVGEADQENTCQKLDGGAERSSLHTAEWSSYFQ